jgi:uncharacterized membrane protein YGL010W
MSVSSDTKNIFLYYLLFVYLTMVSIYQILRRPMIGLMNSKLETMRKEAAVAKFEALSRHLPAGHPEC